MVDNHKLFFVIRKQHGVFKEYILVIFDCFFRAILKNNYTNIYIIIKNKVVNIKIILKILKTGQKHFKFLNRLLFYKIL